MALDADALHADIPSSSAAERWSHALAQWGIPESILAAAPESPWHHPPDLFARLARDALAAPEVPPSRRRALEALAGGGSVLDVGVGGGAASLPLAPPADLIIGLDSSQGMLEVFSEAAAARGVAHRAVCGGWPEAAERVEVADVVVCNHVLYNVGDLVPFLGALDDHARRRVVIEVSDQHPTSPMRRMWKAIHGIDRPTQPTASVVLDVLGEMGIAAQHEFFKRCWSTRIEKDSTEDRAKTVAMMRRRLCVGPERDAEIDALLAQDVTDPVLKAMTIWWDRR